MVPGVVRLFVLAQIEAAKHKELTERARIRQQRAKQRDEEIQAAKLKKFVCRCALGFLPFVVFCPSDGL